MTLATSPHWWVIVPMKDLRRAKSRLGGDRADRYRLAVAMVRDTLTAITGAGNVDGVLVVCERPDDAECFEMRRVSVLAQPGAGLNEAIRAGAEVLRAADQGRNIAVLPGDLPHLSSGDLEVALVQAAAHPSAFVSDRSGEGTTLLTVLAGVGLNPAFGEDSSRAHRSAGATELHVPRCSGLRLDVDVLTDIRSDARLGRRTRYALGHRATGTTDRAESCS
jgi:2-phospho-L-lactate guanylyltransferase